MTDSGLPMWTIYKHPDDYPGCYVVRRSHATSAGTVVHDEQPWAVVPFLAAARAAIPADRVRIERDPSDAPQIVETWL